MVSGDDAGLVPMITRTRATSSFLRSHQAATPRIGRHVSPDRIYGYRPHLISLCVRWRSITVPVDSPSRVLKNVFGPQEVESP